MGAPTSLPYARKLFLALVIATLPLAAQTGLGVVRGTVQDASKAVIPNAKVTLTNTSTGVAQTSETNSAGIYYFGSVQIGPYSLGVETEGFKKWEGTFSVEAGQTVVVDPTLEVGSLQAQVEVTGAAPTITTEGMQVADVKDALRIHDLPIDGRQISNLFDLTPGVVGGGSPRVNGMKVGSAEMNYDGISIVDRFGGGIARMQPGLDTIQEFRIETAGSGAQFSRPATIELVTRSGNNELHGALFETFRDNADGLRARARSDGNTAAKYIRNEYGGYVAGPVFIPHLYNGKNKTFWMFDWEGMKLRQNSYATTGVPTAAMWAGNLSNETDTSGDKYTIYDPTTTQGPNGTRLPFPNNTIPASRISQYAGIFQSVTPTPNIPGNLNPWVDQNFQTYYPVPNNQHTWTIKIDHNISDKDRLMGRITLAPNWNATYGGVYGYPPIGCTNCGGTTEQDIKTYSENIRWNHVFSPTLLNELQLASFRSATHYGTLADSTNWATKLGLPNPFGVDGWPTVYMDSQEANMLYWGGWDGDNNHRQNLTSYEIDEGVTWIKGKHTIKFGGKIRQEYNNVEELQQAEGSHSFYSSWTELYNPSAQAPEPFTGSGLASLELGLPTALRDQYNRGFFYFEQKEFGLYINDTWKVTPRLTVDLGLRWDHWDPYKEKYNRLVNLDPTNYPGFTVISPDNTSINSLPNIPSGVLASWAARGLSWETADSVPGFPKSLVPATYGDFGPRLGVAYRVSDKWVVRAGYGMYYWPMPLSQILQASRTNPPLNLDFSNHLDSSCEPLGPTCLNGAIPNYSLLYAPTAADYLPVATVNVGGVQGISSSSQSIFLFDPHHWADDRMQQWTFTIERELAKNMPLRVSYIGTHGSNLEQLMAWNSAESALNYELRTGLVYQPGGTGADLRRPNPNWNGSLESHVGYSNSTSFQAQVERRFSSGLSFQWSYTYDHALTTSDAGGFSDGADGATVPENSTILGEPNLTLSQRLALVYYNSGSIPPHQIKWNGIYQLPFGRGKRFGSHVSTPVNEAVGGWQVAFIGYWQSGFWQGVGEPMFSNPTLNANQRLTMSIFGHNQMLYFRGDFDPTQAASVNLTALEQLVPVDRSDRAIHPIGPEFNNEVPVTLANGQVELTPYDVLGWTSQNFFLGPRSWNEDLSFFKYFDIKERMKLRITSDFFNFFNHPNDVNPNGTTGLINLGVQTNSPRTIQFSARLEW